MKQLSVIFPVFSLAFMVADVAAQPKATTTQWLYEECKSSDSVRQNTCSAFLLGVAGLMEILGHTYENPPRDVTKDFVAPLGAFGLCSGPITGADVRRAFIDWAERNPARSNAGMSQSAVAALHAIWGCKIVN
jgi:Rap1a immunity proteins